MEKYINMTSFLILTAIALILNVLARVMNYSNFVMVSLLVSAIAIVVGMRLKSDRSITKKVLLALNMFYVGMFGFIMLVVGLAGGK